MLDLFTRYHWHGNVGVLETTLEHAFVLCRRDIFTARDLPPHVLPQARGAHHREPTADARPPVATTLACAMAHSVPPCAGSWHTRRRTGPACMRQLIAGDGSASPAISN